jgi:hypothetical protein
MKTNQTQKGPTKARSTGRPSTVRKKSSGSYSRRRIDWQAPLQTDERATVGLDQDGLFEVRSGRPH